MQQLGQMQNSNLFLASAITTWSKCVTSKPKLYFDLVHPYGHAAPIMAADV
jgi:hypothetical protein